MGKLSLEDRATENVAELSRRKKFTMKELADRASRGGRRIPTTSIHRIIHGTQPVSLRVLESAAELAGTHPLELLRDPGDDLHVVNPIEAQLLRYFRSWPHSTKVALITFASFFADEDPATQDQHRAHQQLRDLGDAQRRLVYAYLLFLTEGDLPPDIRKGLGLPETDAPQLKSPPKRRRRAKPTAT